jgi:hypothetical protein
VCVLFSHPHLTGCLPGARSDTPVLHCAVSHRCLHEPIHLIFRPSPEQPCPRAFAFKPGVHVFQIYDVPTYVHASCLCYVFIYQPPRLTGCMPPTRYACAPFCSFSSSLSFLSDIRPSSVSLQAGCMSFRFTRVPPRPYVSLRMCAMSSRVSHPYLTGLRACDTPVLHSEVSDRCHHCMPANTRSFSVTPLLFLSLFRQFQRPWSPIVVRVYHSSGLLAQRYNTSRYSMSSCVIVPSVSRSCSVSLSFSCLSALMGLFAQLSIIATQQVLGIVWSLLGVQLGFTVLAAMVCRSVSLGVQLNLTRLRCSLDGFKVRICCY